MISIPTDPMRPTIVQLDPIAHHILSGGRAWFCNLHAGRKSRSSEGTMVARGPCGKPTKAFGISTGDVSFEVI
jgi:hypothetical protein